MSLSSDRRHYSKAPIVEAVIDLQVGGLIQTEAVNRCADNLKDGYATRLPIHEIAMGFQIKAGGSSEMSRQQSTIGWRLETAAKDRVLQIKANGFTYSHLAPYSDWETFSGEAEKLWKEYTKTLSITTVQRSAVRVINRLPEFGAEAEIDEYLALYPMTPKGLPSQVDGLFLQLRQPYPEAHQGAQVAIGLYNDQEMSERLILDIDLFIAQPLNADDALSAINKLGLAKDKIFEACITDKVREMIK